MPTWRPISNASLLRSTSREWQLRPRTCTCQLAQENSGLLRPATTHLGCQNHQLGSAVGTNQYWVDSGFFAPGHLQGDTVMLSSTESRPTVCMQGTDQRRVHCKLGSLPCKGRPSTTTSSLRASAIGTSKSMSLTSMLVRTRPPASRHILAATLSKAKPRRPNTPARAQAARWWPQKSSGRPHRQLRTDRGRACRRRRKRITRKRWGWIVVSRLVGTTVSAAPASTPAWERTSACTCSGILVNKSSRYRSSTLALASCCQPDRTVPGSKWSGSRSGGRVPAAAASQLGGSNPMTKVSWRRAISAAWRKRVWGSCSNSATSCLATRGWRPTITGNGYPNSPRTLGCSHDKQIATQCLPKQKAWKQFRPRRPLALEMCGEFCTDTPTPRRHVFDKTRLPSGARPL